MKKFAVVVGISNYPQQPLQFCDADADAVGSALEMPEYGYHVLRILNEEGSRLAVLQALREAIDYGPDHFLFFFAGHGVATDIGSFLVTHDGQKDQEGVELATLSQYLVRLSERAQQVVAILDCCHAGAGAPWGGARALGPSDVSETVSTLVDTRVVLAACRADQKAREDAGAGHGVFTKALLDGLTGGAVNYEGEVTVGSLHEFVATRISESSEDQQTVMRGDVGGHVVLGSGFDKRLGAPVPEDELARALGEGRQYLDEYAALSSAGPRKWKESGHLEASQRLTTILRWFDTQRERYPELRNNPEFRGLTAEVHNRVAQLGSIDTGTRTTRGRLSTALGSGGFGSVWQVENKDDKNSLAFKVFHAADLGERDKLDMFQRGYRAMEQLDHPRIVRVHGYSVAPVGFYMDFVDGPNLRQIGELVADAGELLQILILTGETVQHAHGRQVIHRDIKPENILLSYDQSTAKWKPYLTDFDLAWFSTATSVTQKSFGNLFYAAPEQLAKPHSGAARSSAVDIFAFAQLALFVLTGSDPTPFSQEQNISVLRERSAAWLSGDAALKLVEWYSKATSDDPRERHQDFQELLVDLVAIEIALRAPDLDAKLDEQQFIREVAFGLTGFAVESADPGQVIRSVSSRTEMEFALGAAGLDRSGSTVYSLKAQLWLDVLEMEQVPHERAAALLLRRVNGVVDRVADVTRRSVKGKGAWGVELTFAGVALSYSQVLSVRETLAAVIDAIER